MASRKAAEADDYDDDFDDNDDVDTDDDAEEPDFEVPVTHRGRDWRDIERYREQRALRALIDDDLEFDLDD